MKKVLFLIVASFLTLAGCQNQEDKEKEFKKSTNTYVNDINKHLDMYDDEEGDNVEDFAKVSKKTKKDINKSFDKYKESFDEDALDNYENEEIYNTMEKITSLYTDYYSNVNKTAKINNIDDETFIKHLANYTYRLSDSLTNQEENLKEIDTKSILGKKTNNKLNDMIHTDEDEMDEYMSTFASLQGEGYEVDDAEELPKFDAVKYNKYKNNQHDRTMSANEYNEVADDANEMLDSDSQIKHVDDEVNVYVYNLLMEKYNALVDNE
ncbi:hypothetical protein QI084_10930 [Staphylococcus saprophyticus]|nr:hypothetical protein [Staphylococcus saprophyticus]